MLLEFLDPNIAERNVSVIALQHDRARLINVLVQFASGRFRAFDVVVDFDAVQSDCDLISNNCRFGRLPFVAGFGNECVGRFEIVNGTVSINSCFAASIVAEDLNFLSSVKIEAAVGVVRNHVFEFYREVPKVLVGNQIVSVKVFVGRILKNPVLYGPTVAAIRMPKMPAGKIFAVEERAKTSVGGKAKDSGSYE